VVSRQLIRREEVLATVTAGDLLLLGNAQGGVQEYSMILSPLRERRLLHRPTAKGDMTGKRLIAWTSKVYGTGAQPLNVDLLPAFVLSAVDSVIVEQTRNFHASGISLSRFCWLWHSCPWALT